MDRRQENRHKPSRILIWFSTVLSVMSGIVAVLAAGLGRPYRQNALAQPLVALVQADYYPSNVGGGWQLGGTDVLTTLVTTLDCDYPSNVGGGCTA
jgi:anti-sigma-K factor RskA